MYFACFIVKGNLLSTLSIIANYSKFLEFPACLKKELYRECRTEKCCLLLKKLDQSINLVPI